MNIIFYNHHQHGDLALSRGIVNWIVDRFPIPANFYFDMDSYRVNKDSIFFNERVNNISGYQNQIEGECIFLNLWIVSSPSFINRPDAVFNGGYPVDYTSFHILNHCKELIDSLKDYGIEIPYPKEESDVLPRANFNPKQKNNVDYFLEKIKKFDKKVLICNGTVHSHQCPNFLFSSVTHEFVDSFKNVAFIYTNKDRDLHENEFCINDFCEIPNLNEIDYLSTKCDILITRRSGPGEIIQTYENFFDSKKTFLSFTTYKEAQIVFKDGNAKLDWTNDFSAESITKLITSYL